MLINKVELCGVNTAKLPVLSANEKKKLFEKILQGDNSAREEFIQGNLRLVLSVIQRFNNRGEPADDLFQVGCIGLIKAIDNFDVTQEVQFSTYAVPKIAGEIRRFLRDDGSVKVSRSTREQAQMLYTVRERLRQEFGREPYLAELSERSGLSPEEIAQIDLATETPDSLQKETADGLTLEGLLGTDAPEETMVERIALRQAIDCLPEKERLTILLRYFKALTQEQTARILGVSQVQISRLERRGLQHLRESFLP